MASSLIGGSLLIRFRWHAYRQSVIEDLKTGAVNLLAKQDWQGGITDSCYRGNNATIRFSLTESQLHPLIAEAGLRREEHPEDNLVPSSGDPKEDCAACDIRSGQEAFVFRGPGERKWGRLTRLVRLSWDRRRQSACADVSDHSDTSNF